MKKLTLTLALVLTMGLSSFATNTGEEEGGLFEAASSKFFGMEYTNRDGESLMLPSSHGLDDDADAPLGSGIVLLAGLGAAYLVGKKRKEN